MIVEESRSFHIIIGVCSAAAAVLSIIAGGLYALNLESSTHILITSLLFLVLCIFFCTTAYRLISNTRRKDGGLLSRASILIGSLCFSVYFLLYVIFSKDLNIVQLSLGILGVPLFAWVGFRAFKHRGRATNET